MPRNKRARRARKRRRRQQEEHQHQQGQQAEQQRQQQEKQTQQQSQSTDWHETYKYTHQRLQAEFLTWWVRIRKHRGRHLWSPKARNVARDYFNKAEERAFRAARNEREYLNLIDAACHIFGSYHPAHVEYLLDDEEPAASRTNRTNERTEEQREEQAEEEAEENEDEEERNLEDVD